MDGLVVGVLSFSAFVFERLGWAVIAFLCRIP